MAIAVSKEEEADDVFTERKRQMTRNNLQMMLLGIFITSLSFVAVYSVFVAVSVRYTHKHEHNNEIPLPVGKRSLETTDEKFDRKHEEIMNTLNSVGSQSGVLSSINNPFAKIHEQIQQSLSKHRKGADRSASELIHDDLMKHIDADNIRNNSYFFSEFPHPPGSRRNKYLAKKMAQQWKEFGLDKTEIFRYKVMLDFPLRPAEIELKKGSKVVKKLTIKTEPAFGKSEKKGKVLPPFHMYSASGKVTGEAVFVNYGEKEDYDELEKLNLRLKDKIFIVKYGTTHPRSHLVLKARKRGAKGVIFYADPLDYVLPGQDYPNGWMLNKYGVQRGSIFEQDGDALSIGYPSNPHYYRMKPEEYDDPLNTISQPISAESASHILDFMKDDSIPLPDSFKGALNVTYVLQSGKGRHITLNVRHKLKDKTTHVVCGTLYGADEPDRYILLGNHRDAWTYGASDPVSGTAVMHEVVRVLGHAQKTLNYRPHRSLMICSWGAEEACVLGSTEWADDNANFISTSVVAYLNVDQAVEGNFTVSIKSLDHLAPSIFEAAKQVDSADNPDVTLFEDMLKKNVVSSSRKSDMLKHTAYFSVPGGVSDNKRFSHRYGIATSDYRYTYSKQKFPQLRAHNGNYHTLYDSFDWMSKFVDPGFTNHALIGKLWLKHALYLADEKILPLDLLAYSKQVQSYFLDFEKKFKKLLQKHKISLAVPKRKLRKLVHMAARFHEMVGNSSEKLDTLRTRAVNDRIMHFEKNFVLKSEVGNQKLEHELYSTHQNFFGVATAILANPGRDWDNVRREITLFMWSVDMAIRSLDLNDLRLNLHKVF